jgi:isocitrate dehydrogenase
MNKQQKIKLGTIVDIRGDGTWSPMADAIVQTVIAPFVEVDWDVKDLSLQNRDSTDDSILPEITEALKKHKVGVKGPTITPTQQEAAQRGLKKAYGSPNGVIRRAIDGVAITRAPIVVKGITKLPANVEMLRHAVGGIYGAYETFIPEAGEIIVTFRNSRGETAQLGQPVKVEGAGVGMLTVENARSIENYARFAFAHALKTGKKRLLWADKQTINKTYDGLFRETFRKVFEEGTPSFKQQFEAQGIDYRNMLIDAAADLLVSDKLKPDTLLVFKNYDGDVQADALGALAGSLALVTSELVGADGTLMADPPHGTAPIFDKDWFENGKLMANPTAYIFAYAKALERRGEGDNEPRAVSFAAHLRSAAVDVIEQGLDEGFGTADILNLPNYNGHKLIDAQTFLAKIAALLDKGQS